MSQLGSLRTILLQQLFCTTESLILQSLKMGVQIQFFVELANANPV
jgi:hypothetical protein